MCIRIKRKSFCIANDDTPLPKKMKLSSWYCFDNDVMDIDDIHINNSLYVSEYANDIYRHCFDTETKYYIDPDYMSRQENLEDIHRKVLIGWLVEVHSTLKMHPDTLYLCINLIDRYSQANQVDKSEYQLLSLGCMLIAVKMEELRDDVADFLAFCESCKYKRNEVFEMEMKVLMCLQFSTIVPVSVFFLTRFKRAAFSSEIMYFLCQEILEIALLSTNLLKFKPSALAASAILISQVVSKSAIGLWTPTLEHYTTYKAIDLKECVIELLDEVNQYFVDPDRMKYNSIFIKYSSESKGRVATIELPTAQQVCELVYSVDELKK